MADITGMNIKLGLDYQEVTQSVKSVKGELSTINSEMKKNMSAFDRSEKSVQKYQTRLDGLEKKYDAQGRAVEAARQKHQNMVETYGEGSEEAQKSERALNNQEAAYNNLGRVVDSARQDLVEMQEQQRIAESGWTKMADSIDRGGNSLVSSGQRISGVGDQLSKFSAVAVGAVSAVGGGLFTMANRATQAGDEIAKGATKMGISTDAYQEMSFWAEQNGVDHATFERSVERLNQRMGLAADGNAKYSDAFDNLGVSIEDTEGNMRETEDVMGETIQSLSDIENESERSAAASELFGTRLSRQLMPALEDGSMTMEEAKNTAEELGLVMGQDQLEAAEEFQSAKDQITSSMSAIGMQIGLELMPYFQDLFDWILENMPMIQETITEAFKSAEDAVRDLIGWWQELSGTTQKLLIGFGALAVGLGPILSIGGRLITLFGNLMLGITPVLRAVARAGGVFKALGVVFGALTGPVGITIGVIVALGTALVTAYNQSETFRNIVQSLIERVRGFIPTIVDFAQTIYQNFIEFITPAITSVRDYFVDLFQTIKQFWDTHGVQVMDAITNAIDVIWEVIQLALPTIVTIIQTAFNNIVTVVQTAWGIVQSVISGGIDVIMGIVKVFTGVFTMDFQLMWEGVQQIFSGAISAVIGILQSLLSGAIGIITNIVSGAVNLFTTMWSNVSGIFSSLWDSITNIVSSIYNSVTSWFSNLVSSAVNLIGNMYNSVTSWFSNLWNSITNIVSNLVSSVLNFVGNLVTNFVNNVTNLYNRGRNIFNQLRTAVTEIVQILVNRVIGFFRKNYNRVTTTIRNLYNRLREIFRNIRQTIVDIVERIYNSVTSWFSDVYSGVRDTVTNLRDTVTDLFERARENVVSAVQNLYDSVTELFGDVWDSAKETFDDMVEGAKELPGRIGDAISNAASSAVDGVKSLGNDMAGGLQSVVDGITGGLNDILDAIGLDDPIPDIEIPTFSTGTKNGRLANDTLGVVNDKGPGNGKGGATQELIERNGKMLAPQGENVLMPLKKNDRIYNGAETQSMISAGMVPQFNMGTGSEGGDSDDDDGLWGTFTDVVSDVWDYVTNPKEAFNALIDTITPDFGGLGGFAGDLISGGWNLIKDTALDFITSMFEDNAAGIGSGEKASFMDYGVTAGYSPNSPLAGYPSSFNNGHHYGVDYGTPIGTPVHATTGGNVSRMHDPGGGLTAKLKSGELTQFFMHLSDVLETGSVSQGDLIARTGNSGLNTTGAHIHWQAQQDSDVINQNTIDPRKVVNGHESGGLLSGEGLFFGAEKDNDEVVIPLHKPSEAMKLMNYVANNLKGESTPTSQLPDYGTSSGDNGTMNALMEMIDNQQKQIQQNQEMIKALFGIEDKSGLDDNIIGKANDRYNARQSSKQRVKTGRLSY